MRIFEIGQAVPEFLDNREETVRNMARNLVNYDEVWHTPFIMPGDWRDVSGREAASLIDRAIDLDKDQNRLPILALFPPLRIASLTLSFAPVTLWQIALDADFGVGTLDLVETPNRITLKGQSKKTSLKRLFDEFPLLDRFENGLFEANTDHPPKLSVPVLKSETLLVTAEKAIEATIFALSLSRRRSGRFFVVDPDDSRSHIPPARLGEATAQNAVRAAHATATDDGWSVTCDVVYNGGLWKLECFTETGSIELRSAQKQGEMPLQKKESMVGPIRFYGFELPDRTRFAKADLRSS